MAGLSRGNDDSILHIVDARPKAAAVGNKIMGAGMEAVGPGSRYERCVLEYMNIGNIHVMRDSLQKYVDALRVQDQKKQAQQLDNSHWRDHISRILGGGVRIASLLESGNPVLVHCKRCLPVDIVC